MTLGYAQRKAQIDALLASESASDCHFTINLSHGGSPFCYGPQVTLGGTSPDTGMAVPTPGSQGMVSNPLPGGDLGIWDSTEQGNACTAAEVNNLVEGHARFAHLAALSGAALNCFARNTSDLGLPASGDTETLSSGQLTSFSFVDGTNHFTATAASITGVDGSVLRYDVTATVVTTEGEKTVNLISQYTGDGTQDKMTVSYNIQDPSGMVPPNCMMGPMLPSMGMGGGMGMTEAGKVVYNTSPSSVTLEVNHASFCGLVSALDSQYGVSPTSNWNATYNYGLFSFDPATQAGTYVYAWQAGTFDGATRIFDATLASSGDTQVGTGYFGFGKDITDTSEPHGKIDGMLCNWVGPGNMHVMQPYTQKQVMARATSANTWSVTSENITYAIANACDFTGTFSDYNYTSGAAAPMKNDRPSTSTSTVKRDLAALTDFTGSFSFPTAPTFP